MREHTLPGADAVDSQAGWCGNSQDDTANGMSAQR
jgi:hypothetical protein